MDLVEKLRTCSIDKRRSVAVELGKTRTDQAVMELQNMVGGGVRDYTDRTCRTLWFKRAIRYTVEEQYIAVSALGETGRKDVLEYLKKMYTPSVQVEDRESHTVQGVDGIDDYWKAEVYRYPHAQIVFAQNLRYEVNLTSSSWGAETERTQDLIEKDRERILKSRKSHQVFRAAIEKLEQV